MNLKRTWNKKFGKSEIFKLGRCGCKNVEIDPEFSFERGIVNSADPSRACGDRHFGCRPDGGAENKPLIVVGMVSEDFEPARRP